MEDTNYIEDDDYEINMSSNVDIDNPNLRDYIPEVLAKMYPYRAIYASNGKTLLVPKCTTVCFISQNGVNDYNNLKVDENGERYLEVFYVVDEETGKAVLSGTETFKEDIKKIKSFSAITNDYFQSDNDKPDFYTIGKPFNNEEFNAGKQKVYIGTSFNVTYPEIIQELNDQQFNIEDESRVSNIDIKDVSTVEQTFDEAKIIFVKGRDPITNVRDLRIETLPNIIFDKIKVKGISQSADNTAFEYIDIDFQTENEGYRGVGWMNAVPVNTQDKLEITVPWFDQSLTLGINTIKYILKNSNSSDEFNKRGLSFKKFCTDNGIDESLRQLVLDMMLYSFEFNSRFPTITRNDQGNLQPGWTIGSTKNIVSNVVNTNAKDTVNGLYRKWRKLNPYLVGTDQDKLIRAFIVALSQEFISDMAIAGGENDFNKAILPWALKLSQPINVEIEKKEEKDKFGNLILKDFLFQEDISTYFEIQNFKLSKEIDLTSGYDFNGVKTVGHFGRNGDYPDLAPRGKNGILLVELLNGDNVFYTVNIRDGLYGVNTQYITKNSKYYVLTMKVSQDNSFKIEVKEVKYSDYYSYNFVDLGNEQLKYKFSNIEPEDEIIIRNFPKIDFSETKWVNSERRITLPELDEVIAPINKLNNPGDFSTTSDRDIRYMLKLPLFDEEMVKVFGTDIDYDPTKPINFTGKRLPEINYPYTSTAADKEIRDQIKDIYPDAHDIKVIRHGIPLKIDNPERDTIEAQFVFPAKSVGPAARRFIEFEKVMLEDWGGRSGSSIIGSVGSQFGGGSPIVTYTGATGKWFERINQFSSGYKIDRSYIQEFINGGATQAEGEKFYNKYNGEIVIQGASHANDENTAKGFLILTILRNKELFGNIRYSDWEDIVITSFALEDPINDFGNRYYKSFRYSFYLRKNTWIGYEYTFFTNLPSKELISLQTIYDRPKWKQLIKLAMNINRGIWRTIYLKEKYSTGDYEIVELIIKSIFGDRLRLVFNDSYKIEIKLNQRDDEASSTHRIIFY